MNEVVLVSVPSFDWTNLVTTVKSITGKSPTDSFDRSNIEIGKISHFAIMHDEIVQARQHAGKHLRLVFLIHCMQSTAIDLIHQTDLYVTGKRLEDNDGLYFISGDLDQWSRAMSGIQHPKLAQNIFNYLVQVGLKHLWPNFGA